MVDNARSKVANPADVLTDDEVDTTFARLLQEAKAEERASLNAMTQSQRRDLVRTCNEQEYDRNIEDRAPGGNRLLGRKP